MVFRLMLLLGCPPLALCGQSLIAYWDFENVSNIPSPPLLASDKSPYVRTASASLSGGNTIGSPDVCGGDETWATNFWTTASSRSSSDFFRFSFKNGSDDRDLQVEYISFRASVSSSSGADQLDVYFSVEGQSRRVAQGVGVSTSCRSFVFPIDRSVAPEEWGRLLLYPYNQAAGAQAATLRIDEVYIGGTALLPVTGLTLHASPREKAVVLTWSTQAEFQSDYFAIERRSVWGAYEEVGIVEATGQPERGAQYRWTDHQPFPGMNYYRLRQTDRDGQWVYSEEVEAEVAATVGIYPLPARERIFLSLPSDSEQSVQLLVFDLAGKTWYDDVYQADQGVSVWSWPSGWYVFQAQQGIRFWSIRGLIVH